MYFIKSCLYVSLPTIFQLFVLVLISLPMFFDSLCRYRGYYIDVGLDSRLQSQEVFNIWWITSQRWTHFGRIGRDRCHDAQLNCNYCQFLSSKTGSPWQRRPLLRCDVGGGQLYVVKFSYRGLILRK